MKKLINKILINTVCIILTFVLGVGFFYQNLIFKPTYVFADGGISSGGDDGNGPTDSGSYFTKDLLDEYDNTIDPKEIELNYEEVQLLYGWICEVEEQVDVIDVLIQSIENIELPDEGYSPSYDLHLSEVWNAISDYSDYRPMLDELVNAEVMPNSLLGWLIAIIVAAVVACAAYNFMDLSLTYEMLLHSIYNTELDSVYYPVRTSSVKSSSVFQKILNSSQLKDTDTFNPGKSNSEIDLFLALHHINYIKTKNNSVVEIIDRYDFDPNADFGNDFVNIINQMAAFVQSKGVVTPYQVIIDILGDKSSGLISDCIDIDGYTEKVIVLGSDEQMSLKFRMPASETLLVQTFGSKETVIDLYENNNYVETFYGCGYDKNVLFTYDFKKDKEYTLKIWLIGDYCFGATKLVIIPYSLNLNETVNTYGDIYSLSNCTSFKLHSFAIDAKADINAFTPLQTNKYSFTIEGIEVKSDYFKISVIDPRSAQQCIEYSIDFPNYTINEYALSICGTGVAFNKFLTENVPYFVTVDATRYTGNKEFNLYCSSIQ